MFGAILSRGDRNITGHRLIDHIERVSVKVSTNPTLEESHALLPSLSRVKTKNDFEYVITLWVCRDEGGRYGVYDGGDTDIDFFEGCSMLGFPQRLCYDADEAVKSYIERLTIMERD